MKSLETKCSSFLADCANLPILQCLQRFNSSPSGLTDTQVRDLLASHGPNVLSAAKPRRWWTILLECLPNPFNLLLTVLAIVSIATSQRATFVILMVMVCLSVGLRFWQELKNNVAMNELAMLVHDNVIVTRGGIEVEVPKSSIVVGDIIRLVGGEIVPADVILVDTSGLYISQSTLTGESAPVLKQMTDEIITTQSIFESPKICFSGTTITSGSAIALVIATGDGMTSFI
jgi:P-type Mg2+ transporter